MVAGIFGGIAGALGAIFVVVGSSSPEDVIASLNTTYILTMVTSTIAQLLILPFTSSVNALLYIDLRMRKEGLDVELRNAVAEQQAQ